MCRTRYRELSDLRWYSTQCVRVGMRLTVKVFVRRTPIYYNGSESVMVEAGNRFGKVLLLQNFISSQVFLTFTTPVPSNQPYERARARISYLIPFPRRRVTSHSVTFRVQGDRENEWDRERVREEQQHSPTAVAVYSNKLLSFYFKWYRRLWWRRRPLIWLIKRDRNSGCISVLVYKY